jgi:hypothetical protein
MVLTATLRLIWADVRAMYNETPDLANKLGTTMASETSRRTPSKVPGGRSRSRLAGRLPKSPRKVATGKGKFMTGRIESVMRSAEKIGLLREKDGRITGRVSSGLIHEAKARTGIRSDTDLIAFALANIALEDNFGEVFRSLEGTVDPDLDLEF